MRWIASAVLGPNCPRRQHLQVQNEFQNVLGRSLAEGARAALYRAASTGRATEPRLAGSRGSRPSRVTIAPPYCVADIGRRQDHRFRHAVTIAVGIGLTSPEIEHLGRVSRVRSSPEILIVLIGSKGPDNRTSDGREKRAYPSASEL